MFGKGLSLLFLSWLLLGGTAAYGWEARPVADDPLVRMPGTQPTDGVVLEGPNRCLNCHAGYNSAAEPGFNWGGSMMTHAARDPLFWATVAVAAQDAIWAVGNPNGTDLCLRCHLPKGWLEGRSDPTNATAMVGDDFDGVQCDFCHRMVDPFAAATADGTREGNGWLGYWDESDLSGTPSAPAATQTLAADLQQLETLQRFDGQPYLDVDGQPAAPGYTEATGGQFFVSTDSAKRGPFADAAARHQMLYSRFHKSRYFCATCHDVSNPLLANLADVDALPGDGGGPLLSESSSAHGYFHVERTFSEFMLSAYGQQGGAPGVGPFAPGEFTTSLPGNFIGRCQDCHMRDVAGHGANKKGVPLRPEGSVEHSKSGQPLHDLTGGNTLMADILASTVPGSPNHDPVNDALLNRGAAVLTVDLAAGQGIDPVALLAGRDRAQQQLRLAAAIEGLSHNKSTGEVTFRVVNQTGHKLISGYPEGRRMFVNVRAYDAAGEVIDEINPYDDDAATLKGLTYAYADPYPEFEGALPPPEALEAEERYVDELVYEAAMGSSLTLETKTFHFVLGTHRYKDNRIPPLGFRVADAEARMVRPVWHGDVDTGYFTPEEYAGGYDEISLPVAAGAAAVQVSLFYQGTSREYVQFLSDEIDGRNGTLPGPGVAGDPAYLAQSDPFFSGLKAWGETIWKLWKHNRDVPGAAPFLMAQASVGAITGGCELPVPTLITATPGHQEVVLAWDDLHAADDSIVGYTVYYDQSDKSQALAQTGRVTGYTDSGLSNGELYCYKVSTRSAECESAAGNVLCATPTNQAVIQAGAVDISSGLLVKSGKGKGATTTFTPTSQFALGERVVLRASVVAIDSALPIEGATVEFAITGPANVTVTSSASAADGTVEASWQTSSPNKRGQGGTPTGDYEARVNGIQAGGYSWDGFDPPLSFTLE